MNQVRERIQLKIREYSNSDMNASEQEKVLILELEMETLDDEEAEEANEKIRGREHAIDIISNLPNMDEEQKQHVIDMIQKNEDKKAKKDDDSSDDEVEEESEDEDESEDNNTSV